MYDPYFSKKSIEIIFAAQEKNGEFLSVIKKNTDRTYTFIRYFGVHSTPNYFDHLFYFSLLSYFQVSVVTRDEVGAYKPYLWEQSVFTKGPMFREWILTKVRYCLNISIRPVQDILRKKYLDTDTFKIFSEKSIQIQILLLRNSPKKYEDTDTF